MKNNKVKEKTFPDCCKLNIVVLEMQGCDAEDTLKVLFHMDGVEKTIVDGKDLCYAFPKMNVWVAKEPMDNPEEEKILLRALRARKATGIHWCSQLIVLQKAGSEEFEKSREFLVKKVIPAMGRKAAKRMVVGLQLDRVNLHEKDWTCVPREFQRLCKEIGKRMLITENLYQKQLEKFTGKKLAVVAYAAPELILNPKHFLGRAFNLKKLYEAIVVQLPPFREDWFVMETSDIKDGHWSYSYYEPQPMSEWTKKFAKKFGRMLHRMEKWCV